MECADKTTTISRNLSWDKENGVGFALSFDEIVIKEKLVLLFSPKISQTTSSKLLAKSDAKSLPFARSIS